MCGGGRPGELKTGAVGVLHTTVSASKVLYGLLVPCGRRSGLVSR